MFAAVSAFALFLLLGYAAWFDARWRRFPNWLALVCAIVAFAEVCLEDGILVALGHAVVAIAICAVLLVLELIWRRVRRAAGLGLGDIKALFALVLFRPLPAVFAFAMALALLAVACLVTKRRSLPLLPFLVPVFAIMCVMAPVLG